MRVKIRNFITITLITIILLEGAVRATVLLAESSILQDIKNMATYSWGHSTEGWVLRQIFNKPTSGAIDAIGGRMYEKHRTRGWIPKKNHTVWSDGYLYRTNSYGFRGIDEPNKDLPNIMLLGNSQTFGEEVDDVFVASQILSRRYKKFNFLNLGVGGYAFDQMYITFMEEYDRWKPRHVVFSVIGDDFVRMGYKYRDAAKPFYSIGPDELNYRNFDLILHLPDDSVINQVKNSRWYAKYSFLMNIIESLLDRIKYRTEMRRNNKIRAFKIMNSVLEKVGNDTSVSLVYLSYNGPHKKSELNSPNYKLFEELCAEFSNQGLACSDTVEARSNRDGLRTQIGHYNRLGNEIAAKTISKVIGLDWH